MPISSHCFWPWRQVGGEIGAPVAEAHRFQDLVDARLLFGGGVGEQVAKTP
jgi:hypothetical protein